MLLTARVPGRITYLDWLCCLTFRLPIALSSIGTRILAAAGAFNPRVFGSIVLGDYTEESDLDLWIDPAPGFTLLALDGLIVGLEELPADIGTGFRTPRIADEVRRGQTFVVLESTVEVGTRARCCTSGLIAPPQRLNPCNLPAPRALQQPCDFCIERAGLHATRNYRSIILIYWSWSPQLSVMSTVRIQPVDATQSEAAVRVAFAPTAGEGGDYGLTRASRRVSLRFRNIGKGLGQIRSLGGQAL
jgi:hypothetical protein